MRTDPLLIDQLRFLFKEGATPSSLIRHIADWHAGDSQLDSLVRDYFRESFRVAMIRVGPDQVRKIAEGGTLPSLNLNVLPQMIESMPEWDGPEENDGCWTESFAANNSAAIDPETLPELAGSWPRMDDEAKLFIQRLIETTHTQARNLETLAALAEKLQQTKDDLMLVDIG